MEMDWRQRRTVTILTAVLLVLLAAILVVLGIRYRENRRIRTFWRPRPSHPANTPP